MRRTLWWIGLCVAILSLVGAIKFFTDGREWHRRFDEWLVARPIDLPVDLSAPGTFEGSFLQTCSVTHAEVIEVVTPDTPTGGAPDAERFTGLQGVLTIMDEHGREVLREKLPPSWEILGPNSEATRVFRVRPFREGRYRLTVDVAAGAPALSGVAQRLVARYELCGLERLPGTVFLFLSAGCALACFVVTCVLIGTCLPARHRDTSAPPRT
ncbi:MAG: hypothetical protein ACKVU4_13400 [Phycisphaerales bacterium]